jgi:hypothetical protein
MLVRPGSNPVSTTAGNFQKARPPSSVSGEVSRDYPRWAAELRSSESGDPERSVRAGREHPKRSETRPEAEIGGRPRNKDSGSSVSRLRALASVAPAQGEGPRPLGRRRIGERIGALAACLVALERRSVSRYAAGQKRQAPVFRFCLFPFVPLPALRASPPLWAPFPMTPSARPATDGAPSSV